MSATAPVSEAGRTIADQRWATTPASQRHVDKIVQSAHRLTPDQIQTLRDVLDSVTPLEPITPPQPSSSRRRAARRAA